MFGRGPKVICQKHRNRLAPLLGLVLAIAPAFAQFETDTEQPTTKITTRRNQRNIHAFGLPDHPTGPFKHVGVGAALRLQDYRFKVPLHPVPATSVTPVGEGFFGIALNGVPFQPNSNVWWNDDPKSGWEYDPMSISSRLGLDFNNAILLPNGAYRYKGIPSVLLRRAEKAGVPVLLGYAADGFPIYSNIGYSVAYGATTGLKHLTSSYGLKHGERPNGPGGVYDGTFTQDFEYRPGSGDLDECNGRFGPTKEYPGGIYYYVLTERYPFISRYFRGMPDKSFALGISD